jgi:hypothetical protein
LVDDNLSYRLLLGHLDLFLVVIFKSPMLAVTHHYVKAGIVFIVNYSNHLVVVVQFIFRRVLVVLHTAYFTRPYMCGESRFEFLLRFLSIDLLQLTLGFFEKGSNLLSDFLRLELVARDLFS